MVVERKREKTPLAVCARETDILACIQKMAAAPISAVYSDHLFYFICASLPIQGFSQACHYEILVRGRGL